MSKRVISIEDKRKTSETGLAQIKKAIGGNCACYVLITCSHPAATGKMEVEMDFEGDEDLAAFLIENASQVFNQGLISRESQSGTVKQ
jgi:hypothetical protein